jgi:hypothetical protein
MVESVIVISHDIEDSSEANLSRRLWGNIRIVKLHKYLLFLEKNSNLYNHVMAQILFSTKKKHIVSVLNDGTSPGNRVVEDSWDSDFICSALNCLDVNNTKNNVINLVVSEFTSFSSLESIDNFFKINIDSLPLSAQNDLTARGRCSVNEDQLLSCITWVEGYDEDILSEMGVT